MAEIEHKNLTMTSGIHICYAYSYADSTARTGATGFVSADIGKIARQIDNESYWILTAITPVWREIIVLTSGTDGQADIIYHNGTNWVRLTKGTAAQVLTMNAGATAPTWAAASGGGGLPAFSVSFNGNCYVSTSAYGFIDFVDTKTITRVDIQVGTAPTDATLIVDIHKNGTTIFTNQDHRPMITTGNTTGYTTTIDVPGLVDGDRLEFFVDQVGATVVGANLGIRVSYS